MKKFLVAFLAGICIPTFASAAIIDFDALDATNGQQVPLAGFSEDGFTFSFDLTADPGPVGLGPAIFDTTCTGSACNGDTDLIPSGNPALNNGDVSGNVLIVQEDGSLIPDDIANGPADIVLTLETGPSFRFLGASGVDDGVFSFFSIIGGVETQLGTISLGADGETGSFATANSGIFGIGDQIRINYSGSGGVDSLVLAPVPLPAALPMFGLALSIAGFLGWRKTRARVA